ncbi:MAG TPA: energy transducer TonB [Blastocatellia bacterium]
MKISVLALCVWLGVAIQSESFEKRALSAAHRVSASSLDPKLPDIPFLDWLTNVVGKDAGVVWQLAECGVISAGGPERDTRACAEASALLPKGDVVIVGISVGTFKKGLIGAPAFMGAALKTNDQLYQIRRLNYLPMALQDPESLKRMLPDLQADLQEMAAPASTPYPILSSLNPDDGVSAPPLSVEKEPPPPPPSSKRAPQRPIEMVDAVVIKKVKPIYPPGARTMGVSGKVEVRVIISETGRVIEATAINGHNTLRRAAEMAALQWIFKPATRNGVPVKTESIVPFTFAPGAQE